MTTKEEYDQQQREKDLAEYTAGFWRVFNNEEIYKSYLKPCPFCGDHKMLRFLPHERSSGPLTWKEWEIQCQMCKVSISEINNIPESVVFSWNKRPDDRVWSDFWNFCKELREKGVVFPIGFFIHENEWENPS